jgi:phosphohistidine phosphatase
MPKTLILFRHAKSSWVEDVVDHDRGLSERGRRVAPLMANWLVTEGLRPSLALVSTARRTQETWALAAAKLGAVVKRDAAEIYEATPARILDAIRAVDREVEQLLVIGHNPGLEGLVLRLMRDDGGEAGARMREKFPTAAIAVLQLPVDDWTDVEPETGELTAFVTPKLLKLS